MPLTTYLRSLFLPFDSFPKPMAPGSLSSDFLGFHRSKLETKSYPRRKSTARICAVNVNVTNQDMDEHDRVSSNGNQVNGGSENQNNVLPNFTPKLEKRSNDSFICDSETISESKDNKLKAQTDHLKALSLLHLDVIEQQQRELVLKDKEIAKLRSEKHALEQRIERMQRRTHLAEKTTKVNNQLMPEKLEQHQPIKRKHDPDTPTALKRLHHTLKDKDTGSSRTRTFCSSEVSKRERKKARQLQKIEKLRKRQKERESKSKEEAEKKDKLQLDIQVETESQHNASIIKEKKKFDDRFIHTHILYPTLCDLRVLEEDPELPSTGSNVEVPSWRSVPASSVLPCGATEETTDDTYDLRHQKLEMEEKKRKRWDAQRLRELREIERLEWKAREKEMAKWGDILTSYYPDTNDAKKIEVAENIPVVAFGASVPKLRQPGFLLPWFSIEKREQDESRRQTRSRTSKK